MVEIRGTLSTCGCIMVIDDSIGKFEIVKPCPNHVGVDAATIAAEHAAMMMDAKPKTFKDKIKGILHMK